MRAPERNRLLAALPAQEYARLLRELEPVQLFFPRDAVVSMLVLMEDGKVVESAMVGNEGVVGLEVVLGDGMGREDIVVQIAGGAGSMRSTVFRAAVRQSVALQTLLQHYSLALMNQLARTAGCNRVHSVAERCARWLLMSEDRAGLIESRQGWIRIIDRDGLESVACEDYRLSRAGYNQLY